MTAHTIERRRAWHVIIAFGLAHTVGRRQVWHAIRTFGRQTRSNDVGRGMPSPPLSSSHGRTTSGVACYHGLWTAHTVEQRRAWAYKVERRRAWHAIIAFGLADTVGRRRAWKAIIALGQQRWSDGVGRRMPSSPLDSTDGRPSSGVACHHRPWKARIVGRRRTCLHTVVSRGLLVSVLACATLSSSRR